jgi:hypothetical protein
MVKAYVLRGATKNELDELYTEGGVCVLQAPAGPEDRGVDIRGEALKLTRKPGGNVLVVTGDHVTGGLASLMMDKLFIMGLEVNIDQSSNRAWVNGIGAMEMESATDFEGHKLARPVPLVVHWNKSMDFDGDSVEFHGGIQAEQGTSRLACENLQVYLDREVSLKEGNKSAEPARARKVTCDASVRVEERVLDDKSGELLSFRRLDCLELDADNETGHVHAPGPGTLRVVQPGGSELSPTAPEAPGRAPGKGPGGDRSRPEEWKLTLINYRKLMTGENKQRTATFRDDVKLLYVPWDKNRPNQPVDLERLIDDLPPEGLYLRADELKVYSTPRR